VRCGSVVTVEAQGKVSESGLGFETRQTHPQQIRHVRKVPDMYRQMLDPVAHSLAWSAVIGEAVSPPNPMQAPEDDRARAISYSNRYSNVAEFLGCSGLFADDRE
jgi:hypothetical protein